MSGESNGSKGVLNGLYESVQGFWESQNSSYSDDLNAKAYALTDGPEHTLAYYESLSEDPLKDLSKADKAQIETWMKASENLPADAGDIKLSARDTAQINSWMKKSANLPLEVEASRGLLESLGDVWDTLWGNKYMRDLERHEHRLRMRAAAVAKANN
jgi:hypothetical protein